jgi:hypothetical protein
MTLDFEAFGLIVLMVTWFTPAAQHSEGTCGSKGYINIMENVRKQREIYWQVGLLPNHRVITKKKEKRK